MKREMMVRRILMKIERRMDVARGKKQEKPFP
jgi:hypothetical protein